MNKRTTTPTIYTLTLLDRDGRRHMIPAQDRPAYCGATGEQDAPREHRIDTLCLRCRQRYAREVVEERMVEMGL